MSFNPKLANLKIAVLFQFSKRNFGISTGESKLPATCQFDLIKKCKEFDKNERWKH